MRFASVCWASALISAAACGAGNQHLDPADLELRDVLGLAPEVAAGWDADERAAARDVIERGLHEGGGVELPPATTDAQLATSLATADDRRARAHEGALGVVRIGSAKATASATA